MNVTIYCLCDPRNAQIRYVGKAKNTKKRFHSHLWEDKRTDRKTNWIKHLKRLGLAPTIDVLEVCENSNDQDWQESERFWINYLRFLGFDLTNLVDGGRGGTNPHPESIAKRVAKTTGRKRTEESKLKMRLAKLGKKARPETRAKMSAMRTGKKMPPVSDEWRRKQSLARLGKKRGPMSESHKAKIGLANSGKVTAKAVQNSAAARRGKPLTQEHRKKVSDAIREVWAKRKSGFSHQPN